MIQRIYFNEGFLAALSSKGHEFSEAARTEA